MRGTTRTPSQLAAQAEAGWQIHEFADDRPLADPDAALDGVDALITTITAIWSTKFDKFLAPKTCTTGSTSPRSDVYKCQINKLHG